MDEASVILFSLGWARTLGRRGPMRTKGGGPRLLEDRSDPTTILFRVDRPTQNPEAFMRFLALVPLLVLVVPTSAVAQTPPGALETKKMGTPTMPTLSLPIEVVKATPSFFGEVYYERAGLSPKEFRTGENPQMTGSAWKPLIETDTRKKTVNGRSVTTGRVQSTFTGTGGTCANQSVWVKAWLQFRTTDLSGKVFVSNIKGDSTCVPIGG